jgi:hypothetical protein
MSLNKKIIFLSCALLASSVSAAQDNRKEVATSQWTASQLAAKDLLLQMARQLSDIQRFQVDVRIGYDAMQDTGQKIEFGEQRRLLVERPSLLLSKGQSSSGATELLVFDGKWITVSDPDQKVYARAPQPGDIDATLTYLTGDLGMHLPLAVMLMGRFPEEIEQRMVDISYVEETDIFGEPVHHIAGRTREVDFQVWITARHNALPLRVILTYREEPGQPQYWANFSDWKLNPSILLNAFRFEPRTDEREVPLADHFIPESANSSSIVAPPTPGEQP